MYGLLPLVGIPRSKFLPPASVYANAKGETIGTITQKRRETTNNPFDVGGKMYFLDYTFYAKPVWPEGVVGAKTQYGGTLRVDQSVYDGVQEGGPLHVKYEKSYPWINGVTDEDLGRSVGEGSNVLSGWILYVIASVILAFFIMMILERFGRREDI
jgi:hypothetical protein